MTEIYTSGHYDQINGILEEGFLLDGRYKISRVLGEGGFGITYDAVNIHSGKRVAVKANRHGDPQKFLQEARTLRDFEAETSIVSVLDYFETEGTAYIVMEYLDGIPLSLEIRQKGKWETERAVHSFIPVMNALEHMHQASVIHRDISPDNLMVMSDGRLILMDFGAAKEIHKQNVTSTSVYKSVYSPPEQRESGITLGSYTDVYALCATLYYCITGQEPEDALSRLLFDELKKPSECGADIRHGAEKALMNGLELDSVNRTQEISELREELEKYYPNLTEEEKRIRKQRKKRRNRILLILCVIVSCCILGLLYIFRIQILFSTIKTQSVWLDGNGMTAEDFQINKDKVRERVKTFTDKQYLWKEGENQSIVLTVPDDLFHGADPNDYVRFTITRPLVLSFAIQNDSEKPEWNYLGEFSKIEDIKSVHQEKDGLMITFNKDAAARFNGKLDEPGSNIRILFDSEDFSDYLFQSSISNGDGISIFLPSDTSEDEFYIPYKLKLLQLTQEPLSAPFPIHADWKVRWEKVDSALFPGKNQFDPEEIPGPAVVMKYNLRTSGEKETSGYDLIRTGYPAIIKNRLDSLDTPYAFGMDPYHEDIIVIKIPADRYYWEEEYQWLGNLGKLDFVYGSRKTKTEHNTGPSGIKFHENEDGTWFLETVVISDYDKENLLNDLQVLRQQGEKDFYLYFKEIPVFVCSVEDAMKTLQKSEMIRFDRWILTSYPEMDETTAHFGRFIHSCLEQKLRDADYQFGSGIEYRDSEGKCLYTDDQISFPQPLLDHQGTNDIVSHWQEEYKDSLQLEYLDVIDKNFLRIRVKNTDIYDPAKNMKAIEPLFRDHAYELNSGLFKDTVVFFLSGEKIENQYIMLNFDTKFETGKLGIDFGQWLEFTTNGIDTDTHCKLIEEYETYMKADPFWSQFAETSDNTG